MLLLDYRNVVSAGMHKQLARRVAERHAGLGELLAESGRSQDLQRVAGYTNHTFRALLRAEGVSVIDSLESQRGDLIRVLVVVGEPRLVGHGEDCGLPLELSLTDSDFLISQIPGPRVRQAASDVIYHCSQEHTIGQANVEEQLVLLVSLHRD